MQDDSAIVIGLQNYPGMNGPNQSSLSGPENDAKDFEEWLLSKDGGDVPQTNIKRILSSDYPVAAEPKNCKPVFFDIKDAFDILRRRSIEKTNSHHGPKIGRRLYIFMSGHGITPTPYGNITKEVGLLMSNADDINIMEFDSHFPGCFTADWFCVNGCFEEVFLFMDCCRDIIKTPASSVVFVSQGNLNGAKRFYAFATKWGRRAKERNINGVMRGVFTKTLLLALNGAGADVDLNNPASGLITGASLKSFLINNTKLFLDKNSLSVDDGDEPDIEMIPNGNNGNDIVIKRVPLKKFPVIIDIPQGVSGKIDFITGNSIRVDTILLNTLTNKIEINLPRGLFNLQAIKNNTIVHTEAFIVSGIEEQGSEAKCILQFL